MPLPGAERAFVPPEKLTGYLLAPAHPIGKTKAQWFMSLGYDPAHPDQLAADLLELVRHNEPLGIQTSSFGVKYEVRGQLTTPSGRKVSILTVWIVEPSDPRPRLITAYPA